MRPICSLTHQILFVVCSFTSLPALRADTLLFSDLTDVLTVTTSNPTRMSALPCVTDPTNAETCSVLVGAPSATATIINITPTPFTQAVTPGGNFTFMQEPGIDSISDVIRIDSTLPGAGTTVTFGSDIDPSVFTTCSAEGGCQLTEDGTVQTGATITWIDATGATFVDTIQFQSDVPAIPEPSSLILLGSGLLMLVVKKSDSV